MRRGHRSCCSVTIIYGTHVPHTYTLGANSLHPAPLRSPHLLPPLPSQGSARRVPSSADRAARGTAQTLTSCTTFVRMPPTCRPSRRPCSAKRRRTSDRSPRCPSRERAGASLSSRTTRRDDCRCFKGCLAVVPASTSTPPPRATPTWTRISSPRRSKGGAISLPTTTRVHAGALSLLSYERVVFDVREANAHDLSTACSQEHTHTRTHTHTHARAHPN